MIEFSMTPILWFSLIIFASILDNLIGDPKILKHPVELIGFLISFLTKHLNNGKNRKFKGLIMIIIVISTVLIITILLQYLFLKFGFISFYLFNLWFMATALSEKSLFIAGQKVKSDLKNNDLNKARKDLALIVGRNTDNLNKSEIIRATVETEAENSIDGVIAPLLFMILGLYLTIFTPYLNPLVMVYFYKTVNTLDSMVGYPYEPYKDFGFYSAKLDDIVNFIPARIGSVLLLIAGFFEGYNFKEASLIFENHRNNHLSPNAGHPEAVIAGLLQIKLGGINTYNGHIIEKPTIGIERYPLSIEDITDTMRILILSEELLLIIASSIVLLVYIINFTIINFL